MPHFIYWSPNEVIVFGDKALTEIIKAKWDNKDEALN